MHVCYTYIVPTGPPRNLTATPSNSSSLLIKWSPPILSHQNGIIRHYTIYLQHNDTGETAVYTVINETTVTIMNLKPYCVYLIEIAAFTIGSGPFSTPVVVQLPEAGMSLFNNKFLII